MASLCDYQEKLCKERKRRCFYPKEEESILKSIDNTGDISFSIGEQYTHTWTGREPNPGEQKVQQFIAEKENWGHTLKAILEITWAHQSTWCSSSVTQGTAPPVGWAHRGPGRYIQLSSLDPNYRETKILCFGSVCFCYVQPQDALSTASFEVLKVTTGRIQTHFMS